jgi:hypothetical protein
MTIATVPRMAQRLINYLQANGGAESTTFLDDNNKPDLEAARRYAEKLRLIHSKYNDDLISIVQSYNKVTISVKP